MNGLERFHLEEIEEDEIYGMAGKKAHWSLNDGRMRTFLISICGNGSQSSFSPKALLINRNFALMLFEISK